MYQDILNCGKIKTNMCQHLISEIYEEIITNEITRSPSIIFVDKKYKFIIPFYYIIDFI